MIEFLKRVSETSAPVLIDIPMIHRAELRTGMFIAKPHYRKVERHPFDLPDLDINEHLGADHDISILRKALQGRAVEVISRIDHSDFERLTIRLTDLGRRVVESHNATPQQHQTATSAENPNETD
jgi:hypothetical protein